MRSFLKLARDSREATDARVAEKVRVNVAGHYQVSEILDQFRESFLSLCLSLSLSLSLSLVTCVRTYMHP